MDYLKKKLIPLLTLLDRGWINIKGLKEWNFGTFEGESEDLNPSLPYGDFFVKYGGEAEIELRNRVAETLHSIMKDDDHQTVLANYPKIL